jgi:hypothetical protein
VDLNASYLYSKGVWDSVQGQSYQTQELSHSYIQKRVWVQQWRSMDLNASYVYSNGGVWNSVQGQSYQRQELYCLQMQKEEKEKESCFKIIFKLTFGWK